MGANKQLFMEQRIRAEMDMDLYLQIPGELQGGIEIRSIDIPDYPYEDSEVWQTQYKVSLGEFIKLKEIEYDYPFDQNELWIAQKKISSKEFRSLKDLEFKIRNQKKK